MHMQIKKLSQEFQTIFQHYYHLEKVIIGKTKSIETTNFFFFITYQMEPIHCNWFLTLNDLKLHVHSYSLDAKHFLPH